MSFLLAVLLTASSLMLVAKPAHAETTFTVTNTADPGDGICGPGGCTLREAITAANNTPGADRINFHIGPVSEVKTISPTSGLPAITEAVFIDGYSQPGATENTQFVGTNAKLLIELDGTNASGFDGITIEASNVEVQGLVINDFASGISIRNGASNAKIEGNFIGTNPSGTGDQGNTFNGVEILFGGSDNVVIGGAPRTAHNLISGNDKNGVLIQESSSNSVLGNLIGTKKDGKNALGNARAGVFIVDSAQNFVGGEVLGKPNTIAFNGGDGVEIQEAFSVPFDGFFNRILNNSVYSNGGLGIDLVGGIESATGATANDPGDADTGANQLQNKPFITSASTSSDGITIL